MPRDKQLQKPARQEHQVSLTHVAAATTFIGPLPPPETLAGYEHIVPGAAERLLSLVERQNAHRQQLEVTVVEGNLAAQKRGQWMAFTLALLVVTVAGGLILAGRTQVGVWVLLADLLVLAGAFIYSRRNQQRERSERRDAVDQA